MHHEANKNSMNSCQLIPTNYMTNIQLKRIKQMNGSRMKDMELIMNDKQARSKFQGVSPVKRSLAKEDRNEEKSEFFSAASGFERKIAREENEIEKNKNVSKDGVVEHSKVQALESRKICQKFGT